MSNWKDEILSKARNDQETLRAEAVVKGLDEFISDQPDESFNTFEVSQFNNAWLVTATSDSGKQCQLGFETTDEIS